MSHLQGFFQLACLPAEPALNEKARMHKAPAHDVRTKSWRTVTTCQQPSWRRSGEKRALLLSLQTSNHSTLYTIPPWRWHVKERLLINTTSFIIMDSHFVSKRKFSVDRNNALQPPPAREKKAVRNASDRHRSFLISPVFPARLPLTRRQIHQAPSSGSLFRRSVGR